MEKKIVTKDADFAVYSQIYTSFQTPVHSVRGNKAGLLRLSPKSLLKESSKHCRYNSNPWN